MLERFTHVTVSKATAQRHTQAVGLAYETVQRADVERIDREWPDVPLGPDKLLLSLDGAFVPLVRGEWAEVKTLVVGEGGAPLEVEGERVVPTHTLSYFSRLSEAESFQRLTLCELYRRGVETAGQVAVVSDGAEWIQSFVDYHCPAALRILDFPHAAERICQLGEVVLGEGSAAATSWRTEQLHHLKHDGPATLMPSLRGFAAAHLSLAPVSENLAYLAKRLAHMQYPSFQAQGWPIGSGSAESANKLVVEVRLKGAGMHWARASVNPMLALRNAVCNDRWDAAWAASTAQIRRVGLVRRGVQPKQMAAGEPTPARSRPVVSAKPTTHPAAPRKPAADHPWRRTYQATKARIARIES